MSNRQVPLTTYFLQMHSPASPKLPPLASALSLEHRPHLSPREYRALYNEVGAPWLWYERANLSESELAPLIQRPDCEIILLKEDARILGFAELLRTAERELQLLYFGLKPQCIGRGIGGGFLNKVVEHAFASKIDRLWVHTCTLDHPRALQTYEKIGFAIFRQESGIVEIPEFAWQRQQAALQSQPHKS